MRVRHLDAGALMIARLAVALRTGWDVQVYQPRHSASMSIVTAAWFAALLLALSTGCESQRAAPAVTVEPPPEATPLRGSTVINSAGAGGRRQAPTASPPATKLGTAPEGAGLAVGSRMPEVAVVGLDGAAVPLADLGRPLMVVFYRGGWCPFCNTQLRELTAAHAEFAARGVTLAVISVDQPTASAVTDATYDIPFPVLSDPTLVAHEAFRVVQDVPAAEIARLASFGMDLEAASGQQHHKLAMPSAFLFRADGTLAWRHVDPDYKTRPSPAQLVGVIDQHVNAKGTSR